MSAINAFPERSKGSIRLSALPKGDRFWRIDWLGDIAFPDRMVRRTQPSVFVHLSPLVDETVLAQPEGLLAPAATHHGYYQRRVWVSVGTLPLLRVGDIWQDGELVAEPDYELEAFQGVQIDDDTTQLIKAGLNLDERGFLLPLGEHPWHRQATQSYCLSVDLPGSRQLVIPCMELIRFYFGSSSGLLTKVFLPPLLRESLYTEAQFNKRNRQLSLDLADRISGSSASDIGRIHLEPAAWRSAAHIGASMLKASVAGQAVYPQAFFPFEGKTNLVAAGKWLSFEGRDKATFVVFSLRSCSYPFPFRSLRYKVKHAPARPPRTGDIAQRQAVARRKSPDEAHQTLDEVDASSQLAHKTKTYKVQLRFPDLAQKPVWKSKDISPADSTVGGAPAPPMTSAAVGQGGSTRRTRPIDFALLTGDAKLDGKDIPAFLKDTVLALRQLSGIDMALLTDSDADGWTVPVTVLCDDDGEIDPRLFLSEPGQAERLRRACAIAFKQGDEHICAVLVEAQPLHCRIYPDSGNDEQVWALLRCAAQDFVTAQAANREQPRLIDEIAWVFDAHP